MADYEGIAKQFVQFYYQTFDADRAQLASLYRDESVLTFETNLVLGGPRIVEKLVGLPFQKVQHQLATLDAQPAGNGIVILVTGALLVDEEERPMNYSQVFHLLPNGSGSYYVANDIFKLIYG